MRRNHSHLGKRGHGYIMLSEEYPSIRKKVDLKFVLIEFEDTKNYTVHAGNEKTIPFSKRFEFSKAGFADALKLYNSMRTPEMIVVKDYQLKEEKRLNMLFKEPKQKRQKVDPQKLKLFRLLDKMKENGKISFQELTEMWDKL